MANYKLVNADQLDTDLKAVANKIREKADLKDVLQFPSEFIEGIEQCSSLNFSVVGGTVQPGEASENTIWVNTDKEIRGWVFSAAEPASPVEGMVWILVGDSSSVSFNALNSNTIQVYPKSVKQYIGTQWLDKVAKSYQVGKWVDWFVWAGQLYDPGNEYKDITGGWVAKGMKANSSSEASAAAPTVERTDTYLSASNAAGKSGIFYMEKTINTTGYTSIVFEGTFVNKSYSQNLALLVWSKIGTYYADNVVARKNLGEGTHENVELDISGLTAGSYYIGFAINAVTGNGSSVKFTKGNLKK